MERSMAGNIEELQIQLNFSRLDNIVQDVQTIVQDGLGVLLRPHPDSDYPDGSERWLDGPSLRFARDESPVIAKP